MTDLQLGLAIIGAIVIAAVIAYNKWQEARLSRRTERQFGSRHEDVLAGGRAGEPPGEAVPPAAAVSASPVRERIEHTIGGMDAPPARAATLAAAPDPGAWPDHATLDAGIDCIVSLECPSPVSGADAIATARALLGEDVGKPVRWEGAADEGSPWGPLVADARYGRIRAGLQLVDRAGPVSEEELGAFFQGMQEAALALAAAADFPEPGDALEASRSLDAFCAEVDVQIGLNVIATADQPFAGTKLRSLAEAGGLRLGADGVFHRFDELGHELFSLTNGEGDAFRADAMRTLTTPGVTVTLDVPRAPGAVSTFRLYLDFARQLEQALGGMLVDDHKRPVGQATLEQIARQLERIYAAMDARGISAGSPAALRLFA